MNKWFLILIVVLALGAMAPGIPGTPPVKPTQPAPTDPPPPTEPVVTKPPMIETEPVVVTEPPIIVTEPPAQFTEIWYPEATQQWPVFTDKDKFKEAQLPKSGYGPAPVIVTGRGNMILGILTLAAMVGFVLFLLRK